MASRTPGGQRRRKTVRKASRWHVPSFFCGVAVGMCLVLLALEAPDRLSEQAANLSEAVDGRSGDATEELVFRFEDLLRNSEVPAQPERYGSGALPAEEAQAPAAPPALGQAFHIQVASFTQKVDADQLRAKLLLQAMPAQTAKVDLENGAWYRVTLGPIASAEEAERMMDALRRQKFSALWIRRS